MEYRSVFSLRPAGRLCASALGLLLLLLQKPGMATGQEVGMVRGTVVDAESGRGLVGANIQVPGTVLGTITGRGGGFVVSGVPVGSYSLRVSMIGYRSVLVDSVRVAEEDPVLVVELVETAIGLNPVIVTADRRLQRLEESSSSVTVLPRAEIAARTNLRLDDALEMVPGVYFMEEDINIRGVTGYRANAGSRVLLLLDGTPLITSDTGGIGWDMVPIQDIERVEVVKGAGSALWGSGAIGGVVNVITRRPSQRGVFTFRSTAGLYDDPSEEVWVWAPDRTLGYTRFDLGYSKAVGSTALCASASRYASTGDRQDGDFNKWNLSGKLNHRFSNAGELEFYAAWLRDHSGVFVQWRSPFEAKAGDVAPSQLFHPFFSEDEGNQLRLTWINTYLKYSRPLGPRTHLRIRGSLLRSMLGNQFDTAGAFSPAHGPGLEVQLDWLPADRHIISAGFDGKVHLVRGKYFDGSHREYAVAAYLQDEWQLRTNLRFTAGVRLDRHEFRNGPTTYQANPRLGLNYRPAPALSMRASAGRGFRVPTVAERAMSFATANFSVLPTQRLDPERSWTYEAGIRKMVGNSSYLDVAVFQNNYRDFVEPLIDLGKTAAQIVVSFQNVPDARIRGFELAGGTRGWRQRLQVEGGLTFLDSKDLDLRRPLAYRPRWSGQLSPSVHLGRVHLRVDYRYASRLEQVTVYASDQRVAQHELNLRLRWELGALDLTAGVNNVLNYNYTQIERNLGEIRNFAIGLSGSI